MATLMQASHQWATRPADQRFLSLFDLDTECRWHRQRSIAKCISSRGIEAVPVDGDYRAVKIMGPNGVPADITNWAFGQLAQRAGAPASYMRELPGPLAADCINYGLKHSRDVAEIGVLLRGDSDHTPIVTAMTGPNYGRVWNETITSALVRQFGDGVTGDFRVPGEFGKKVPITLDNTTLYASDRDMFVFLADEERKIEMPNRRDGKNGQLSRGFFLWNSEVGSTSFGVATFLFDYVCMNRIVWGAEEDREVRFRHTSSAPDKWIEQVAPALNAYAKSSTSTITAALAQAQAARVDDVDEFLKSRKFTNGVASAIKAAHLNDEQRPMESLWDVATGITAYARSVQYQDERVRLERQAGQVLDLVA